MNRLNIETRSRAPLRKKVICGHRTIGRFPVENETDPLPNLLQAALALWLIMLR
ncbi:MAG: hypothetical protein JWN74_875 [Acidobacteriaceae bacterium]|nr:hypothetical protein [Acidobacteriaceae bacterium]